MLVSANPWKFGTEIVPRCIFFSQYIAHDPSCSSHITVIVRAAKPQSQKQLWDYLSHLLVWHVVVDVVATMEVVVKASPENERRMKFGAQEHKNCCNSGWASCQQWEFVVGDIKREVRPGYGFANCKVPTASPFCRNQDSSRCDSLETPNSARNLDRQCPLHSFSAKGNHEWNQTVAMDIYIGFICLLMFPEELHVFGRLRQVWWAEG